MEVLQQLKNIGSQIEKLITNFKKDGSVRKTPQYLAERLQRLQNLASEFHNNYTSILKADIDDLDQATEYYDRINQLSTKYIKILEHLSMEELNIVEDNINLRGQKESSQQKEYVEATNNLMGAGAIRKQQKVTEPSNTAPSITIQKLSRNQKALMRAIDRNIEEIQAQIHLVHPVTYYTVKCTILEKYMTEFQQNNELLWEATTEDHIEDYTQQTFYDMEEKIASVVIELHQHMQQKESPVNLQGVIPQAESENLLPKIPIPTFSGNYMQWMAFKDLYVELVHKSNASNARKMHYLLQALTGEPKGLIQHLPAVGENYAAAWMILTNRYDNKRLIVTSLLNKLFMQPSVKNESATSIKALHDVTQECLHGLAAQELPVQHWDAIISHILIKKLDAPNQALFEQGLDDNRRLVSSEEVLKFIERRFQALEARCKMENTAKACTTAVQADSKCQVCKKENHPLYQCGKFTSITCKERWQLVNQLKLCGNCLRTGHRAKTCKSRHCTRCTKKHNTLLHAENAGQGTQKPTEKATNNNPESKKVDSIKNSEDTKVSLISNNAERNDNYVLLGTALINLIAANGQHIECRALLDSGSQVNFITERLAKRLGKATSATSTRVQGIGTTENKVHHRTTIQLQSKHTRFSATLDVHVLPRIVSDQPAYQIHTNDWNIPRNLTLADPSFATPGRIDCLLGAEIYLKLLTQGRVSLARNLPMLQNTVFGWIIAGNIDSSNRNALTCGVCTTQELENTISKFWQLEDTPQQSTTLTENELRCESHFAQHTKRAQDGRFIVKLPLMEHPSVLGDSKAMAYSRFLSLERRLNLNAELKAQYSQFLKEYEDLGHMTEVHIEKTNSPRYFLPHHCVLRPHSSTTRLRVVFDASAKTSNGKSLNDIMYTGPTVQSELFSLLLRFRIHKFVMKTDIEKMYRQIWVDRGDQHLQTIMWRNNHADSMKYYQLQTVTYGTRAAPYLATRCLNQLSDEYRNRFPLGAAALKTDFYVDDGLLGADSIHEALEIQQQLIAILTKAGMKLRKWCSNNQKLLHGISPDDQEINLNFDSEDNPSTKTLGLLWLPKSDVFRIEVNIKPTTVITKRSMTSDLARIFDPLGLLGPVVVTAKMYIQQLWQLKIDWDATLPKEIEQRWKQFQEDLPTLNNLAIPRHVLSKEGQFSIQLHVFADASEKAYGAAAYIRTVQPNKGINIKLLCAKSRVAPLKQQSIPRLELCAALLAAELITRAKLDLNYQQVATYCWTDSQIVLSWIANHPGTLPVFVAHRVIKIKQLTNPDQWHHVSSKDNPADILSRGLRPRELPSCLMWFYGPLFLYQDESSWSRAYEKDLKFEENTEIVALATTHSDDDCFVYRIPSRNSFQYVLRVTGYVLRFVRNIRKPKASRPENSQLSPIELEAALKVMVLEMQATSFQELRQILLKNGHVPNSNSLNTLTPFFDEEGIIRVGGRLHASSLGYDAKHQMLLPRDDPLTRLLVEKLHKENNHCGPTALMARVKQRFWPLNARSLTRSVVQHCVYCTRTRPKLFQQIMGNLPALRVEPARPFMHSGVDYCGPFKVHFKTRGKPPQKAYIAIFCCFSTKAVHLELVTDLTTDAFLGALKRFISRRGHCKSIFCDNATNFVGAKNQLQDLKEVIYSATASDSIIRTCSERGINFQFIPPRAPHFGGLWEAAVKSTKKLLAPRLYESSLTFEELNTVVIEIEAMLNSRPLVPMSSDPNDLEALTPGHFLIGEPLTSSIDVNTQPCTSKMAARWEEVSRLKRNFWKRWSTEYLSELQQRYKWKGPATVIKPGTMVILKEDNCPVLKWPLGRIVQVHQGDDGVVRVCDIKTHKGIFQRPITRLAPLFPEDNGTKNIEQNESNNNEQGVEQPPLKDKKSNITLPVSIPLDRINMAKILDTEAVPKKTRRIDLSLAFIMIAILFVPLICCNPINVTEFESQPGLYFEQLGTIRPVTTNWNMIVYYDLEPYRKRLELLNNGTNTLQVLCDKATIETACPFLVGYFEHVTTQLQSELKLLSLKRIKRGAVDLVGNIANSLFGVLDSNYEAKMSETIESLQQNDEHLEQLLKNQTSLIDSTINIFKKDHLNIQAKFEEIDNQINELLQGHNASALNNKILILTLAVQMFMVMVNLQETHKAIMDTLIDSHHEKINPFLLTPEQLDDEVQKIKARLPPNLQLPIHQNNLLEIYKLMKVTGVVAENHVVFSIELPLTNSKEFNLLYLVPIAIAHNGALAAVQPSTQFIAVKPHHDEFIPLSADQLEKCMNLNVKEWLCPNMQATYYKASAVSQCELDLLNKENEPRCVLHILNSTSQWTPLKHQNQWIYATTHSIRFTAVCGNDNHQFTLNSSGLLQLRPDCTIKNNLVTIEGHNKVITSLHARNHDFGIFRGWANQYAPNLTQRTTFNTNIEGLESIQRQLSAIQTSNLQYTTKVTNNHSIVVSYMAIILTLVVAIALGVYLWKAKHQHQPPPIPPPRRAFRVEDTTC